MSYTHKAASFVALKEGGKSDAIIADLRQAMRILKDQHINCGRGVPSLLLGLLNEARKERKDAKAKKRAKRF